MALGFILRLHFSILGKRLIYLALENVALLRTQSGNSEVALEFIRIPLP